MNRLKTFFRVLLLIGVLGIFTPMFGAQFYLSTEKSFMETEKAEVKIESRSMKSVNVRLYKVPDPQKFIKSRKNINRVYIESENIKSNPAEILLKYGNNFKRNLLQYGSRTFKNKKARKSANKNIGNALGTKYVKRKLTVGINKNYKFIREFEKELSGDNAWTHSYIDFGKLSAGLYLTEVYNSGYIAYSLVHVSKIAMFIKKSDTRLMIQTLNKATGKAVKKNITVYNFKDGKKLKSGTTSDKGIYNFKFKKNQYSELLVFAGEGKDFTFYKVSLYPTAKIERMVYIYTDSPIYKPGQTVHIKGVIRDFKNSIYVIPNVSSAKITITGPRGNKFDVGSSKVAEYGSFVNKYEIKSDGSTGMYKIVAKIGKKTYKGEFKVRHYVKPKFKVDVKSSKKIVVGDERINFTIKAKYFTGNAVKKGKVRYSIFKTPAREDIMESKQDIFEDPAYASKVEFVDSKNAILDDNGEFSGGFSPKKYGIDRDYVFIIKAEVTDESYARGSGQVKVKVVQAEFFMQARIGKAVYTPGENVNIRVKLAYADGRPVKDKSISYKATLDDGRQSVSSGKKTTDSRGNAKISFKAKGKGFLKVAIKSKDSFGNKVVENVYTWIGKDGSTFVYSSGDITIVFDKDEYQPGDKARILIVSPVPKVNILISSERDDVYKLYFKKMSGNTMMVDLPITKKYTPNFFFTASFMFNNQIYENTVKVKVPPKDKVLNVKILTDKKSYYPRKSGKITVKVTDSKGKPVKAEVSLAVVNEALYRISADLFPDPRLFFYSYRWNSVTSMNSIALRFYGYSRVLRERYAMNYYNKKVWAFEDFMSTQNAYAGSKEAESKKRNGKGKSTKKEDGIVRKIFKDQIFWQGKLITDSKGKGTATVQFPDNLTEWRIVAIAVTKDTKVGKTYANIKTAKDFFVRFNIPKNLSYLDVGKGYATIINNTKRSRKITVSLSTKNINTDFKSKTVTVPAKSEKVVKFKLKPYKVARARITMRAKSGKLKDAIQKTIDITPVSIKQIYTDVKIIRKGTDLLVFKVPAGAIPSTIKASIGLSEMENPYGMVAEALPYVKGYPYGCVEQTTSGLLPTLVAYEVTKKLGMSLPGIFDDKDALLNKHLDRLYNYQNKQGGWGWWSGNKVDIYMTAYVMYALSFVKRIYPSKLDNNVYYRGTRALRNAVTGRNVDINTRVYGYYVLSLCGYKYKSMIQRMAKENITSPYALALLIMTAKNTGLSSLAKELSTKLEKMAVSDTLGSYWSHSGHYWYGDRVIVTSVAVRALIAGKPKSQLIDKGIIYLAMSRTGNYWRSTRQTAEAIYALSDYAMGGYMKKGSGSVSVSLNGKTAGKMSFSSKQYKNTISLNSENITAGKSHTIKFPSATGTYVASVMLEYHEKGKSIAPANNGIAVIRKYYKIENKKRKVLLGESPSVKAGDVVLVEVSTSASKPIDYAVLEDTIPAGFLPLYNVNEYNVGIKFFDRMAHHEFGKNKASFFFKYMRNGKYYYLMQATYPGIYYTTPTVAYGMYKPEDRGNSRSSLIQVKE